jgi:glycosyltransferase involved in cell wall biosynthesis
VKNVSVLMTVYNRPRNVLGRALHQLMLSVYHYEDSNTEVIVVDDGSTERYDDMIGAGITVERLEKDPNCYSIDGTNNPSRAWNHGLDKASGDIIVCLASDCLVPRSGIKKAANCGDTFWQARTVNDPGGEEFLGASRLAPYGWFMAWDRRIHDIRWDENYMRGIAFEDNDMTARLAKAFGGVNIDLSLVVKHQSHPQIAYSDNLEGWKINEAYTREKWGGIPWCDPRVMRAETSLSVAVEREVVCEPVSV